VLQALGLRQYLLALDRLVVERRMTLAEARALGTAEIRIMHRAYPAVEWWRQQWGDGTDLPVEIRRWLTGVIGRRLDDTGGKRRRRPPWKPAVEGWAQRSTDVAAMISDHNDVGVVGALALLKEQRDFYRQSGDDFSLIRSLCRFSARLVAFGAHLNLAVNWAEEARHLDPSNPYAWTASMKCWLALGHENVAIDLGYEALDRFPDERRLRNELAQVLKSTGRLEEAEAAYRDSLGMFPKDGDDAMRDSEVIVRNGLAEVLKNAGRLDEAEAVYRESFDRFEDNVFVCHGLAEVLKNAGRLEAAEWFYRYAYDRFKDNPLVYSGLADALRGLGRLDEAESIYREAFLRFRTDDVIRRRLADLLRSTRRSEEAEQILREGAPRAAGPTDAVSAPPSETAETADSAPGTETPPGTSSRNTGCDAQRAPAATADAGDEVAAARTTSLRADLEPPLPPLPAAVLRSAVRRALETKGSRRDSVLAELLTTVNGILDRDGSAVEALYAKVEILIALRRVEDADAVLETLPHYLLGRPEFSAARGRIALIRLNDAGRTPYAEDTVQAVVQPWESASRASAELRHVPALQRLRASAVMFDGARLDDVQQTAVQEVHKLITISRTHQVTVKSHATSLTTWWLHNVGDALACEGPAESVDPRQVLDEVRSSSDRLDSLEDQLLSASRYLLTLR
jgi:tetratricopeptide (TPR) repeat protein